MASGASHASYVLSATQSLNGRRQNDPSSEGGFLRRSSAVTRSGDQPRHRIWAKPHLLTLIVSNYLDSCSELRHLFYLKFINALANLIWMAEPINNLEGAR
ncbi:hypothetical protein CBG25_01860 [Arsenophonus sp. ENCA]|nr:hypothetical protein CBG25_01860 [Arsenophonus sp. ENCA]